MKPKWWHWFCRIRVDSGVVSISTFGFKRTVLLPPALDAVAVTKLGDGRWYRLSELRRNAVQV